MTALMMVQLLVSAAAIIGAGTLLARAGDVLAAHTKLGGLWVGSVFLALATSLPEIATDIAAVRLGAPDLAAGDLFGSSMANMVILAIVTLAPAGTELFRRATLDHALYAALATLLTAIAAASLLAGPGPTVARVSMASWLLLAAYLAGSRVAFRHSVVAQAAGRQVEMSTTDAAHTAGGSPATPTDDDDARRRALRRAIAQFVIAAIVLLVAAPMFARSAEAVAVATGLGTTFVGTWLVGFSTSLPELVTSLAAIRLKAYDLAVGNLFGSNAFNMAVFPLLDAAHAGPPVLSVANPAHAISALVAIALMAIALAALVYRARGRLTLLEPSALLIILGYLAGLGLVFSGSR